MPKIIVISVLLITAWLLPESAFAQLKEYDCLVLQVRSEVTVTGRANIGGFKCHTRPLTPEHPLPSCFMKSSDKIQITDVEFQIPVNDFDCGNPLILNDLRSVLEADKYPNIEFVLKELTVYNVREGYYKGAVKAVTTVRGVQKAIVIPVEVHQLAPKEYSVSGLTNIQLSWYGIAQPSRLFGLLTLEDKVEVAFELYFTKSK